jgi:hypothetical protein
MYRTCLCEQSLWAINKSAKHDVTHGTSQSPRASGPNGRILRAHRSSAPHSDKDLHKDSESESVDDLDKGTDEDKDEDEDMSAYGGICSYEGEVNRAFSTLNIDRASTSYYTENVDYDDGLEVDAVTSLYMSCKKCQRLSYLAPERARKQYEAITIL